jgi:hypothetical protein
VITRHPCRLRASGGGAGLVVSGRTRGRLGGGRRQVLILKGTEDFAELVWFFSSNFDLLQQIHTQTFLHLPIFDSIYAVVLR